MRGVPIVAGCLVCLGVMVAGCASSPAPTLVGGVDEVAADAVSVAGDGSFSLRLRVVEESTQGRGVPGAAVAVHLLWDEGNPPESALDLIGIPALGMRTDQDGRATAYVEPGGSYAVVVKAVGWTQEYALNVTANESVRHEGVVMPVYRSAIPVSLSGGFAQAASVSKLNQLTGVGATEPEWRVHALTFHESPAIQRAYLWRTAGVTLRLTWDNGVQEYGDLGVGVGFAREPGLWWYWDAATQMPGDGSVREDVRVGHGILINGRSWQAESLLVGPTTGSGVVTTDELDYRLDGFVEFSADTVRAGQPSNGLPVPGFEALAVVSGVGLAVLLGRRARPSD